MKNNALKDIIIVTGPTASGKSDYAVNLALDINIGNNILTNHVKKECVIISADSRQIYKHLDIGSGKITRDETQNVKHFGLDIASPTQNFTAANWLDYAKEKIIEINNENKIPIICGGTGLYIDALLYGITDNPAPDFKNREILKSKDLLEIQNEIKSINLEYWNTLNNSEQNNRHRLIRKLEILKINSSKLNQNNLETKNKINLEHNRELKYNILKFIILKPNLEILQEKINLRLKKRLEVNTKNNIEENNLISEVKNLLENNIYTKERLISFGLEYKYVTQYILGEINYEDMVKILKLKIFQYAKRQIAWNKRYSELESA